MSNPYCPNEQNRYGYSIKDTPYDCYALTDDPESINAPTLLLTEYKKADNGADGIKLEFTPTVYKNTSPDRKSEDKTGLIIYVDCDKSATTPKEKQGANNDKQGRKEIYLISQAGCPAFDINHIFNFIYQYRFLFGGLLVVVGLFTLFFGLQMMHISVFSVASVSVTFLFLLLIFKLIDSEKTWAFWTFAALSLLVGFFIGFIAVKIEKFGVALVGGAAGFALGLVISNTF